MLLSGRVQIRAWTQVLRLHLLGSCLLAEACQRMRMAGRADLLCSPRLASRQQSHAALSVMNLRPPSVWISPLQVCSWRLL